MRALDLKTSAFRRNLPALAVGVALAGASIPMASADVNDTATTTPIKHVIVIIGENRTFDQIFATYEPVNNGETVLNLLSEEIVKPDGSPGPNYGKALQYQASDTTTYQLTQLKAPYATLPPALVGGPTTPYVCQDLRNRHRDLMRHAGERSRSRQTRERAARRLSQVSSDRRHGSDRKDTRSAHLVRWAGRQPSSARPLPDHVAEASLRRL